MKKLLLVIAVFLGLSSQVLAGGHAEPGKKFDPATLIMHHISDAHEWHFAGEPKIDPSDTIKTLDGLKDSVLYDTLFLENGCIDFNFESIVALPLPVMVIDGGFKFLGSSSQFYHNVKKSGSYLYGVSDDGEYALFHEHLYKAQNGVLTFVDGHPEQEAILIDLSVTKNVASMILSAILLFLIFGAVAKGYKKNEGKAPKGIQSFLEPVIIFVRDDIAKLMIGHNYARFMPFLLTVFFFIWINNLLGLVPGGANLTGNIAFTLTLAVFTFIVTTISGNKHYWQHIFALPGVPKWTLVILTPIEIIGMFVKPVALMIRLFANISAGHIIILSIVSLVFIAGEAGAGTGWGVSPLVTIFTLVMNVMELLVAFLQAFIFTMLSALFIGQAVADHEHH